MKSKIPSELLPRPVLYLTQVSCLFPRAAKMTIEYRIEARECDSRQWHEVDHRPLFPIHADDKENRFHRAMFFHRRQEAVMTEADEYIWRQTRHTEPEHDLAVFRFWSLRIPFPEPGEEVERFERKPFHSYPEEQRKRWWTTTREVVGQRCQAQPGGQ